MGYRSTWIAVPRDDAPALLTAVGLAKTDRTSAELETGWWLITRGDWAIVVGSGWDHLGRIHEEHARRMPQRALFFSADDTPMQSRLALHQAGEERWALTRGESGLGRSGSVPSALAALADAAERRQREDPDGPDHLYEVPHEAGAELVGFRHEEFDAPEGTEYVVLRPSDAPPPTRVDEEHGPFRARFELLGPTDISLTLTALRAVTVTRCLLLFYRGGEVGDVMELAGRRLAAGERLVLALRGPDDVAQIFYRRLFWEKALELRVPAQK